ncbi:MAG: hypothetical protein SGJ02_01765 [bacterium]|nr:hypothetical protein [bacterium]
MEDNKNGCCGSEKIQIQVEPSGKGVKIEVTPKSSCSTESTGSDEKKSETKSDCGCC